MSNVLPTLLVQEECKAAKPEKLCPTNSFLGLPPPHQLYAQYIYRLFEAAQAIEFSVGCQAKCSNFMLKS